MADATVLANDRMLRYGKHDLTTIACGLLVALCAGCMDDADAEAACACGGQACWECVDVGADLTDDARPDYAMDAVLELAEGVWQGTHPDALDGDPIELQVTVERTDGAASYRAARARESTCELPRDAADRCAGLRAPARVEIVAAPEDFSFMASELRVDGRMLGAAGDRPGARNFDGFPWVDWEVFREGREFNMFLLFSADGRLWMRADEGGSTPSVVEIGGKR
jgi:hypothetical protein